MLELREKRKIRKKLYSPLSIAVLFAVAVVVVKGAWDVHAKEVESRDYLISAQEQLAKISATESQLASSVAALNTQEGVETDIRSQFLVAKPGEQVAVIVDNNDDDSDDAGASASGSSASSTPVRKSFWQRLMGIF